MKSAPPPSCGRRIYFDDRIVMKAWAHKRTLAVGVRLRSCQDKCGLSQDRP